MAGRTKERLSPEAVGGFCAQAALLLSAGIPLQDGLETLAADGDGLCAGVSEALTRTGLLSAALESDSRWPEYAVKMVAVGERTGRLEESLKYLSGYYAREGRLRSAVAGAAAYPAVLGGMLALIVLVMLWKVFPVFERVLAGIGVGLTGTAGSMMQLGRSVGWTVLVLTGVALSIASVCAYLMNTKKRADVMTAAGKFGPVRRIRRNMASARAATALSLLLGSGFPADEALEQARDAVQDAEAAKKIDAIRESLLRGETLADAMVRSELFEGIHNRMIRAGAAAGREHEALAEIAGECTAQVEAGVEKLTSVIEPTLVVLLTVVIGAVIASVMLPMAQILTGML